MVFNSPTLEYSLLAPILIILAGALIGVLIEAFVGKTRRPIVQLAVALASLPCHPFTVLALIHIAISLNTIENLLAMSIELRLGSASNAMASSGVAGTEL